MTKTRNSSYSIFHCSFCGSFLAHSLPSRPGPQGITFATLYAAIDYFIFKKQGNMTNEQYGSWHADNEFQPNEKTGVINVSQNERILSAAVGAWLLSSGLRGLFRHPINGLVKTALGGIFLYRGVSGHCPMYASMGKTKGVTHTDAVNIRTALIVNKPKDEVYAFWRKLENLPLFMKHLSSVTEIDAKHSHWEATLPGNIGKIKWNAEIVKEEPGRLIGWQSIPNSMINNAGKVTFTEALGGQGTELEVVITYHPPAGDLGSGIAKATNPVFEKMVRQDVMNFKDYIETRHNPIDMNSGNDNPNILRTESQSVRQG
jgi:uncharacterized membrane protein